MVRNTVATNYLGNNTCVSTRRFSLPSRNVCTNVLPSGKRQRSTASVERSVQALDVMQRAGEQDDIERGGIKVRECGNLRADAAPGSPFYGARIHVDCDDLVS